MRWTIIPSRDYKYALHETETKINSVLMGHLDRIQTLSLTLSFTITVEYFFSLIKLIENN